MMIINQLRILKKTRVKNYFYIYNQYDMNKLSDISGAGIDNR